MSNKSPNLVKLPSILSLKTNKSDLNNTRLICIYKFIYLMLQMSFVLLNAKLKLWTLITLFERAFLVRHSTTKNSKTKSKCSTATYQTALWEKSRLQSQKILGSIFFVLAVWNGSNRWTNERTNERQQIQLSLAQRHLRSCHTRTAPAQLPSQHIISPS